jgi:hypothetical protein
MAGEQDGPHDAKGVALVLTGAFARWGVLSRGYIGIESRKATWSTCWLSIVTNTIFGVEMCGHAGGVLTRNFCKAQQPKIFHQSQKVL